MKQQLISEAKRFQFLAGIITESQYLNEFSFYNSPDEDTPGNKQFVAFKEDDKYNIQGNTHGELSHAIKHFGEFNPSALSSELNGAISYIKTVSNPILKNINGSDIASGDNAKKQLTPNAILNTFDFINDKIANNQELTPEEKEIKSKFLDKLNSEYDKLVQEYISGGTDVDNMKEDEIKKLISSNKKIKFKGSYKGNEFEYVLDPSNAGLLAKKGDNVSTLFRIDKKGNDIGKIGAYFSRGVEITNPELKKALNIQTQPTPQPTQ
jgi:hypothetical protein